MNFTKFRVDYDKCIGCGLCEKVCPGGILHLNAERKCDMDEITSFGWNGCWKCEHCLAVCPKGAISIFGKKPEDSISPVKVYDSGIKYQILEQNEADACPGYSTDAQLVNTDKFTYLTDDKGFWPPYYLAPIVRNELLEADLEIAGILNSVSAKLDTETMVSLNARVDIDHMEYDEVAREFYKTVCK